MQCKSCNAELPKKAKQCPNCGTKVYKEPENIRVIALAGAVIAFIGGLLPFVQNNEDVSIAYSYMNIENSIFWYLFMIALVVSIVLVALKQPIFSIISTALAGVIFGVSLFASNYTERISNKKFLAHSITDLLSDGQHSVGCGIYVIIIGLIVAIVGVFIDILKHFKKDLGVDPRYLTNAHGKKITIRLYTYRWFYLMFLPVLIFILIFNYWPMLGIRYAFTDYIIRNPYYVGLKHFVQMFTSDTGFWSAFKNTLFLSIIKLFLNTGAAVIISLLLHEMTHLTFKKAVQTIVYLPHFMSWVVVASIFKIILNPDTTGLVNTLLVQLNIIPDLEHSIYFLGSSSTWVGTYFVINIWKDTGWGTILFLATLSGISPELYEAAQIDGANRWNRMRFITFPALANTIITVFILNLAKVMNLFESVFVLYNPNVYEVADVLQTYIYRKTFGGGTANYGYTTAVGLFRSLVSCILVLGCNYASKKVRGRGIV